MDNKLAILTSNAPPGEPADPISEPSGSQTFVVAGVKGLRRRMEIETADGESFASVATVSVCLGLPPDVSGAHSSRITDAVDRFSTPVNPHSIIGLLGDAMASSNASSGRVKMSFPFFAQKKSPASRSKGFVDCDATVIAEKPFGKPAFVTVRVRVSSVIASPVSLALTDRGSDARRVVSTVEASFDPTTGGLGIEDLVAMAEMESSCETFGTLRREDLKRAMERACDHPKLIEEIVRDIALRLADEPSLTGWKVRSETVETFGYHALFAQAKSH